MVAESEEVAVAPTLSTDEPVVVEAGEALRAAIARGAVVDERPGDEPPAAVEPAPVEPAPVEPGEALRAAIARGAVSEERGRPCSSGTGSHSGGSSNMSPASGDALSPAVSHDSAGESGVVSARTIFAVYHTWCRWLDNPEEGNQLEQMLHTLSQGGEQFRSFVQFLARVAEPHRSVGLGNSEVNDVAEDEAQWRSCTAMRVACHAFTSPNTSATQEGVQVLNLVCYELLGGLQPRQTRGNSMHICTVLQHLMSAHDMEVTSALLQYHAPFVLIRALNRPGCAELLLGFVLGCEAPLPALSANQNLKPLSTEAHQQVLHYLTSWGWNTLVAALLDSGVRKANAANNTGCSPATSSLRSPGEHWASGSPAPASPAGGRRRSWPSPGTPGWPSPGLGACTPQRRLSTPRAEASPLLTLPPQMSSPSPSQAPSFLELPVKALVEHLPPVQDENAPSQNYVATAGSPQPRSYRSSGADSPGAALVTAVAVGAGAAEGGALGITSPDGDSTAAPGSPGRSCGGPWTPGNKRSRGDLGAAASPVQDLNMSSPPDVDSQRGVSVLIEFLASMLEICGRSSEQLNRRQQQQDQSLLMRAEARLELLQMLFVKTALISHLFRLLRCGVAQFESAQLLHALLQNAQNPNRRLGALLEPMIGQYLPHVDTLGTILLRGAPHRLAGGGTTYPGGLITSGGASASTCGGRRPSKEQTGPRRELRLNSYTVREPLGALRVSAVQILAALCDVSPERTLIAVKPQVWELLVRWFLVYRCNHIFQAACGRLFVASVQHGSVRLQHLIFAKLRLISGICDIVLAEGACGDRWQELRPRVSRAGAASPREAEHRVEKAQVALNHKRHPGGLGGIVPVVVALDHALQGTEPLSELIMVRPKPGDAGAGGARQPLAPRTVPQPAQALAVDEISKLAAPSACYMAKLLAGTAEWPQVVGAIGRAAEGQGAVAR
mmetsp:Transcript_19928/g.37504  ORF Transcript_19928/g.37504 Transcript_19928/m.37504 type:complete len:952 (+) Transcript_19928:71-2926(+)